MSESPVTTGEGFDALRGLGTAAAEEVVREPKIDAQGRAYATGKRKNAVARVWIKPGKGEITINGRDQTIYFARPVLRMMIAQPLQIADRLGQFDVIVTVEGSGLSGQAGAVRHGIARALVRVDEEMRSPLRHAGFLTRDPRMKERKKPGLKRARKAPQYTKR